MPVNPTDKADLQLASGGTRVLAAVIDFTLLTAICLPLDIALYTILGIPLDTNSYPIDFLTLVVVPGLIYIGFWRAYGATPGKLALGARITDAETGSIPSLRQLVLRFAGYYVSMLALFLGFFAMRKHPRRQAWHDRWARTVVVELPLPVIERLPVEAKATAETPWGVRSRALFSALVLVLAGLTIASAVMSLTGPPRPLPARANNDAVATLLFRAFRFLIPITQLAAGTAATLLVMRSGAQTAARALALALAAYWVGTRPLIALGLSEPVANAIRVVAHWIALGALLRFIALFPRSMPSAVPIDPAARPAAFDRFRIMMTWLFAKLFTRGRAVRSAEAHFWLDRLTLDPRIVWPLIFVIGLATLLYARVGNGDGPGWLQVIRALVFIGLVIQALRLIRLRYRSAESDDDSKRLLWLVNGVYLVLLIPFVLVAGLIVFAIAVAATGGIAGNTNEVKWIVQSASYNTGILVARLPTILLTAFLIFAVFYKGALDPNLTIRKTTLYGALAIMAMVVFAGFEYLISNQISGFLKLSDGTSNVLAGVLAAAAIAPVRGRVKQTTDGLFDRLLPAREPGAPRELAIVFCDFAVELPGDANENAVSLFHKEARAAARRQHGRLVKTIGDAALLEFKAAKQALSAARELSERFASACEVYGLDRLPLRAAVHQGPITVDDHGDLSGETVNLAARLQRAAKPNETLVSRIVAEQKDVRSTFSLELLGELDLKGLPDAVEAYRVVPRVPAN